MAVNWNALLAAPNPGMAFQAGMEQGRQWRFENEQMQLQRDELEARRADRKNEAQQADMARISQAAQALGPVYQQLSQMPYEQRRAWLQQVGPRLAAHGIPAEIVAGYDPTDQNLQADIALTQRVQQQSPTSFQRDYDFIRQRNPELAETYFRNHAEGSPVVFDVNGDGAPDLVPRSYFNGGQTAAPQQPATAPQQEVTATNPQTGQRIRLNPQSGQWEPIQGGAGSGAPAPFSASQIPANFTSGRRTELGNRLVGGVPDSAHLRGDAADFTPRAGQSMGQLAADLRRRFPGARIINEGDHVHVQQRGWNVPYHGRRGTAGLRRN